MNGFFEKIYYNCPVFIQNIAIGILGYKLAKERFQNEGEKFLKELKLENKLTSYELSMFQEQQFLNLARHAIENTYYYNKWASENSINSNDIKHIKDLAIFPVIEKQLVREHPEWFRANSIKNQFILNTSGTTGTPLTIYTDKASRSKHYAFFTQLRESYGVTHVSKRATLFGRIIMKSDCEQGPFWRYDWYQKNLLMSSYHLKESNLKAYYDKLISYKPEEIFAYPSSLTPIAEYIVREKLPKISLKLIMTTAENLSDYQRQIINSAFTAPLVNQYGCTEMAFFIFDHGEGMFVKPQHGILEVRNVNGSITESGRGELIATGLINWSMPIIRYAIGDDVELATGRELYQQKLNNLKGRIDDTLYKMDGTPVGRLDPIFKEGKAIKKAQIIQNHNGHIVLKLVPSESYHEKYGNDLKLELQKRFGSEMPVKVEMVSDIAKQKNGKFRPVISNFKPDVI